MNNYHSTAVEISKFLNTTGNKGLTVNAIEEWLKNHYDEGYEIHNFLEGKFNGALKKSIVANKPYSVKNA